MKVILGIGNYGYEYEHTRHNAGFDAIDKFADLVNIQINKKDFKSLYGYGTYNNERIFLLKTQTYVNLSGDALRDIISFYKTPVEDIIILVDDMDTDVGKIRLKFKGTSGGHNGLKSIISVLHTESFKRIKIGISKPVSNPINYVLGKPKGEEYLLFDKGTTLASEALKYILDNNFEKAMTKYNSL